MVLASNKSHGGAGRGQGRKPTPEPDALRVGSIRMTGAQWEKVGALGGGAWVRASVDNHDELLRLRQVAHDAHSENMLLQMKLIVANQKLASAKRQNRRSPMASLEPELLARLIRLCHPDKHNNSDASNAAMAWLLKQRDKKGRES